jgi:nitroreductase
MLDLTPDELLTTTRSVRRRLDLSRPVERALVEECLHLAFQAPNGSNLQLYDWVLVDDPTVRAAMATIYRAGMQDQIDGGVTAARRDPPSDAAAWQSPITASVFHLRDHLHEVPVLVVPTVSGRLDGTSIFDQASRWGSVLPAVWSFMLALRTRGLGSTWTTVHLHREQAMAELLGIPALDVTQVGLFPVAYTIGTTFRRADRAKSASSIRWNHW